MLASRILAVAALLPFLAVAGCGDSNVTKVKGSTLPDHAGTTIGKAFDGAFDDPRWRAFTSDKGATIVEFTGRISARLHQDAVAEFENAIAASAEPLIEIVTLFEEKKDDLPPGMLVELARKHACPQYDPEPAQLIIPCGQKPAIASMRDVLHSWAETSLWPAGTPAVVQWTIDADRRRVRATAFSSDAWTGTPTETVLGVIYR